MSSFLEIAEVLPKADPNSLGYPVGHSGGTSSPPAANPTQLLQTNSLPTLPSLPALHLPQLSCISPQLALSCAQLSGQITNNLSPSTPLLIREGKSH